MDYDAMIMDGESLGPSVKISQVRCSLAPQLSRPSPRHSGAWRKSPSSI